MPKSHSHGENAGNDTKLVRYLIANDGTFGGIHDEPDVSLDTTDFDIGLVISEDIARAVIIVVNKRIDTDSGSLAVIRYLLMGNGDVVQIL